MRYPECNSCVATPFCKFYSGEMTSRFDDWCRGKFKLDKALELSEVPSIYRDANIHNFKQDQYNAEAFMKLSEKVADIVALIDAGENYFFFGTKPGAGKTYAATVLLNHFIYKTCTNRFDFENPLALFVVFPDLVDELRYERRDDAIMDKFEAIRQVPLLLLDDIGAGTMTDFVREQTFRIINYRLNKGLSTIITSNYPVNHLGGPNSLGIRIVSRLMSNAVGIEFSGKDRRRV